MRKISIKKILFFYIILLNIFAIFNNNFLFANISSPEWYVNKISDNNFYIYEVGEGVDKQEAIKNAFKNLNNRIINKIDNNGNIDKNNFIINYSEYVLDKFINLNKKTYVMLSFNKNEFLSKQKNDIRIDKEKINSLLFSLDNANIFIKKNAFERSFNLIKVINNKILIIKSFIEDYEDKDFKKFVIKVEKDYKNILKNLSVCILINGEDSEGRLFNIINDFFIKKSIKVSKESKNIFFVDFFEEKQFLNNFYILGYKLTFKLMDSDRILYYRSLYFDYKSTSGYEDCYENIYKEIKSFLDKSNNFFDDYE